MKKNGKKYSSSVNTLLPNPTYTVGQVKFWRSISNYITPVVILLLFILLEVLHVTEDLRLRLASDYSTTYMHTLQATVLVFFGLFISVSLKCVEAINNSSLERPVIQKIKNMTYSVIAQLSIVIIYSIYSLVMLTTISSIYSPISEIHSSGYVPLYFFLAVMMITTQLWSIFTLISFSVIQIIVYIESLDKTKDGE